MAGPEAKRRLKQSQRGWIKGRDACWRAMQVSERDCVAAAYRTRLVELGDG